MAMELKEGKEILDLFQKAETDKEKLEILRRFFNRCDGIYVAECLFKDKKYKPLVLQAIMVLPEDESEINALAEGIDAKASISIEAAEELVTYAGDDPEKMNLVAMFVVRRDKTVGLYDEEAKIFFPKGRKAKYEEGSLPALIKSALQKKK